MNAFGLVFVRFRYIQVYFNENVFASFKMATDGGSSRPSSEVDQEYGDGKCKFLLFERFLEQQLVSECPSIGSTDF